MPDLVEKFFRDDLTEAEQQALSDTLLNSDEAALKFEETAKQAYLRYGFPEPKPRWTDPPPSSSPPKTGLGPWFWPAMFVVGATLGLGWRTHFFSPQTVRHLMALWKPSSTAMAKTEASLSLSKDSLVKPFLATQSRQPMAEVPPSTGTDHSNHPVAENPQDRAMSRNPPVNSVSPPSRQVLQATAPVANPVQRVVTPINVDLSPPQTFSNLSVIVGQSQLGFLAVRVLDTQGKEITRLYRGNLSPGNWDFEWNGKLADGLAATPGYYKIEVRSGSTVQSKTIQIQ